MGATGLIPLDRFPEADVRIRRAFGRLGILLNDPSSGLVISTLGLSVKLQAPLVVSTSGIGLSLGNGLVLSGSDLTVKLKTGGGLAEDANGVYIDGGISATITTAKLTTLGANGSMTFTNGVLTAHTDAT